MLRRPDADILTYESRCAMTSQEQSCGDVSESGCLKFVAQWSEWSNCRLRLEMCSQYISQATASSSFRTGHTCGWGTAQRHLLCVREDGVFVAQAHCDADMSQVPVEMRACVVECPVDCVMSEWSVWTACNTSCGLGMQTKINSKSTQT